MNTFLLDGNLSVYINFHTSEMAVNDNNGEALNVIDKEEKSAQLRMFEKAKRKNLRKKVEVNNLSRSSFLPF